MSEALPAGLRYHCDDCKLVVPSDAPAVPVEHANCARVVRAKLSWFNSRETRAAQHVMAVATWCLIHEDAIRAGHGRACEYQRRLSRDRKALYAESEVRKKLSADELATEVAHRRDGWLHK